MNERKKLHFSLKFFNELQCLTAANDGIALSTEAGPLNGNEITNSVTDESKLTTVKSSALGHSSIIPSSSAYSLGIFHFSKQMFPNFSPVLLLHSVCLTCL